MADDLPVIVNILLNDEDDGQGQDEIDCLVYEESGRGPDQYVINAFFPDRDLPVASRQMGRQMLQEIALAIERYTGVRYRITGFDD